MLPALNLLAYLHFKASTKELLTPQSARNKGGAAAGILWGKSNQALHLVKALVYYHLSLDLPSQILVNTASLRTFHVLQP